MSLLDRYCNDAERCRPLAREEEPVVIAAARLGEEWAKERIVLAHVRLVISVAGRYIPFGVPAEDLVQEGLMGLLHAVGRFDAGRRTKFSTYALFWIRYYVQRAVEERGRSIRLPARRLREIRRLATASARVAGRGGGAVETDGDLAAAVGWPVEKVRYLRGLVADTVSLDAETDREGGGLRLVETISDGGASEAAMIRKALRADLRALLRRLPARAARVLALRFGFDGDAPRTLADVARNLRLSPESIRQIERRALDQVRRLGGGLEVYLAA
jgi:RNA polymerase nonessential primary-like sigma factor